MDIKISVIVPVYKVEQYLERCVKSILEQSLKEIEIILVDDGSPDNCPAICDQYAAQYKNIKVIHKENQGLGFARNSGMEVASGEYLAFVDSDDYIAPDSLKQLYEETQKHHADTVIGLYNRVNNDGSIVKGQALEKNITYSGHEEILEHVLKNMLGSPKEYYDDIYLMMSVWMGLYSRKIIEENKIRFPSERQYISEDLIFDLDYFPKCRCVRISDIDYYYYCENGASLTLSYRPDRLEKNKILFREMESKCNEIGLDADERLFRSFLGRARQCIYSECQNKSMPDALRSITEICKDEQVRESLAGYTPLKKFKKHYLIWLVMKHRLSLVFYVLCKVFK